MNLKKQQQSTVHHKVTANAQPEVEGPTEQFEVQNSGWRLEQFIILTANSSETNRKGRSSFIHLHVKLASILKI